MQAVGVGDDLMAATNVAIVATPDSDVSCHLPCTGCITVATRCGSSRQAHHKLSSLRRCSNTVHADSVRVMLV